VAHGAPDDSDVRIDVPSYRVDDQAELAVRLGSAVIYSRSGSVMYIDTFDQGFNSWSVLTEGDGSAVVLSNESSYGGSVCCRIDTGTGSSPYAAIYKMLPTVIGETLGLQFCIGLSGDIDYIDFVSAYGIDNTLLTSVIRYSLEDYTLSYLSAIGTYVVFASDVVLYSGDYAWHNIKFVIDLSLGCYLRCLVDSSEYSMTGLYALKGGWTDAVFNQVYIKVYGLGVENAIGYVDNVILTYNEPI